MLAATLRFAAQLRCKRTRFHNFPSKRIIATPGHIAAAVWCSRCAWLALFLIVERGVRNPYAHLSAIISPIGIADVAAGEGALQTCSILSVCTNKKSWTSVPSRMTA